MNQTVSIVVVIPCYNEEKRLPREEFTIYLSSGKSNIFLLFINDGSTDKTREVLESIKKLKPENVGVLELERNSGKAEAVRQGMLWASENKGRFQYAAFMDADLSTPLSQIALMENKISAYNFPAMLMGSRVKIFGTSDIRRSEIRHYAGRIIATLISKTLRLPVYDTQCGFKFFRSDIIPDLFSEKFESKWIFDVEIIFRLIRKLGRTVIQTQLLEIPVEKWHERGGSKISITDALIVPFELFRIKRKYNNL